MENNDKLVKISINGVSILAECGDKYKQNRNGTVITVNDVKYYVITGTEIIDKKISITSAKTMQRQKNTEKHTNKIIINNGDINISSKIGKRRSSLLKRLNQNNVEIHNGYFDDYNSVGIFSNLKKIEEIHIDNFRIPINDDISGIFENCENIKIIPECIYDAFNVYTRPIKMNKAFYNCKSLISIENPLSLNLNSCDDIFTGCDSLKNVNINCAYISTAELLFLIGGFSNNIDKFIDDNDIPKLMYIYYTNSNDEKFFARETLKIATILGNETYYDMYTIAHNKLNKLFEKYNNIDFKK